MPEAWPHRRAFASDPVVLPMSAPPPPPPMAKPGAQYREVAAAITLLAEAVADVAGALREFVELAKEKPDEL